MPTLSGRASRVSDEVCLWERRGRGFLEGDDGVYRPSSRSHHGEPRPAARRTRPVGSHQVRGDDDGDRAAAGALHRSARCDGTAADLDSAGVLQGKRWPAAVRGDLRARTHGLRIVCNNVFANAHGRGYYFTEYPPETVRSLGRSAPGLEPVERLGLFGDEWWMVRGGRHDVGIYMDLAGHLADDETAAVTDAIATRLEFADAYLVRLPREPRYEAMGAPPFRTGLARDGPARRPARIRRAAQPPGDAAKLVGITGNDTEVQHQARELASPISRTDSLPGTLVPTCFASPRSAVT